MGRDKPNKPRRSRPEETPVLHRFAVGELYKPGVTSWPDGHAELVLTAQGANFLLTIGDPALAEVEAFRRGNAEFAVVPGRHHLMWCYRFVLQGAGIPWSDAPWEYHRQQRPAPALPGARGSAIPLHLFLVDANTGILEATRLIGVPGHAADALRDAVDQQRAEPLAPWEAAGNDVQQTAARAARAAAEIRQVYARHATTTDLVLSATARFEALRDGTPTPPPPAPAETGGPVDPQQVIHESLGSYLVPGRRYHSELPADVAPWYCYVSDSGHNIAVALDTGTLGATPTRKELVDALCPAPVKAVLRAGWRMHDGFPICELPYDRTVGLRTPPDDDEY